MPTFYTTYYSCNASPPSNAYSLFYAIDSFKIILDNMVQPFPNPSVSRRFYGKRISNKTSMLNEILNAEQIKVFPNPVSDKIYAEIANNVKAEISLLDVYGREVKNTLQKEMDIRDLHAGIYFVKVQTEKGIVSKKLVVGR